MKSIESQTQFTNPLLSGFYPDPSICRVDDDYYLVTSSFVYYPGLPVFHSKDLINWEQIGHGIHRPDQLDYRNCETSLGLWAPTIRFHEGTFYIINTFVSEGREARRDNFIITAKDPKGPWSDPIFIEGADGIDPSLFFDDDGRLYYTGNYIVKDQVYEGHHGIYLQELDKGTLQFCGPRTDVWNGLKTRSKWIEAPHLYKMNGYYYLMVAEGGTFEDHSVMIARSGTIDGDYEICPRNPIVSHRHMPLMSPISVVGHGDLVKTQTGQWWMVLLGVRPYAGFNYNLGRETFLLPMTWDHNGWPRIDNATGTVNVQERRPNLPSMPTSPSRLWDHFEAPELSFQWNTIHPPAKPFHSLTETPGCLTLSLLPEVISDICTPAFIGRRQQHHNFTAAVRLSFDAQSEYEEAGLTLIQDDRFNISLLLGQKDGSEVLRLKKTEKGCVETLTEFPVNDCRYLAVESVSDRYIFSWGSTEHHLQAIDPAVPASLLSSTTNEGFTGTYLGMYATSNGKPSDNTARFHWFSYMSNRSQS